MLWFLIELVSLIFHKNTYCPHHSGLDFDMLRAGVGCCDINCDETLLVAVVTAPTICFSLQFGLSSGVFGLEYLLADYILVWCV